MLRVFASSASSPQPKPQHQAVIASWKGRLKSSAAARFFSTYAAPTVAFRRSSPFSKRFSSNTLILSLPVSLRRGAFPL